MDETPERPAPGPRRRRSLGRALGRSPAVSEDQFERRFAAAFARHWEQVRAQNRPAPAPPPVTSASAGASRPVRVPHGVDLAAAWAWRFLVIVAAAALVFWTLGHFMVVVLPLVVALFAAALLVPFVELLSRGLPRGVASILVVLAALGSVALMITFATRQIIDGGNDLAGQVVSGLDEIRTWLQEGPLRATDEQIDTAIDGMQDLVVTSSSEVVGRLQDVGTAVGHIVAGFFIVLFATYFFLADGDGIWRWVVRLFPRAARERADTSGRVAWASLTQFVRATVLVALVDAAGIMIAAAVLDVPFVFAIGVLVFLGAFVPLVGATVSGGVAILVALVAQGPFVALLLLAAVIGVQQLEAHVLQPFLLGRMVSVHPLAVILAIAVGVLVAGIAGALVAVPLAATVNAVVLYLSGSSVSESDSPLGDDVDEEPGAGPAADGTAGEVVPS